MIVQDNIENYVSVYHPRRIGAREDAREPSDKFKQSYEENKLTIAQIVGKYLKSKRGEMRKMDERDRKKIIRLLESGAPVPPKYKSMLFPEESRKEYELKYAGKDRGEDILADAISLPFQPIKTFGRVGERRWHNMLIFGDNLPALKHLLKLKDEGKLKNPDGSRGVKLVYIDPPFATKEEFKSNIGQKAYTDKIAGARFIEFIRKRLVFLREVLAENGSIWVHLDDRMDSQIRIILDEIFNPTNFLNEIIWYYPDNFQGNVNRYANNHNTILVYSKTPGLTLNRVKVPLDRPIKRDMRTWDKETGKVVAKRDKNGKIVYKTFTDKYADDVWQIGQSSTSKHSSKEYLDFPTQKPEELLYRIIKSCSEKEDIVLDCFAGSGTASAVAEKLGRKWIMIDSSKLAIYTIQKRMLNLRKEIGNRGKKIKPKPFALYNAGLYKDGDFLKQMQEDEYKNFVAELFQVQPAKYELGGLKMHGYLNNRPVQIFSRADFITHEYINDLHKTVGSGLKDSMYIIAPASVVRFNEDYVDKNSKRYYVLRVPYSIIEEIKNKGFKRIEQPVSEDNIDQTIESVGFDFVYPPKIKCKYYRSKAKGKLESEELVIEIKEFEPVQITRNPVEFEDPRRETLSMIMIDRNYNRKFFDMDDYFFGEEIAENNFKVKIPNQNIGKKMMIIYLDVLGNEKREVKTLKDFKRVS